MSVLFDTQELAAKAVNVLLTKIPDKGAAFGGYPKWYCVIVWGNIELVGSHSALMRKSEREEGISPSFLMRSSASHSVIAGETAV